MTLIQEIEKVIAELPPKKASMLSYWLNDFKAAQRRKQIKAYAAAFKALADFRRTDSDVSLN